MQSAKKNKTQDGDKKNQATAHKRMYKACCHKIFIAPRYSRFLGKTDWSATVTARRGASRNHRKQTHPTKKRRQGGRKAQELNPFARGAKQTLTDRAPKGKIEEGASTLVVAAVRPASTVHSLPFTYQFWPHPNPSPCSFLRSKSCTGMLGRRIQNAHSVESRARPRIRTPP